MVSGGYRFIPSKRHIQGAQTVNLIILNIQQHPLKLKDFQILQLGLEGSKPQKLHCSLP
jgi:hypothetical protein